MLRGRRQQMHGRVAVALETGWLDGAREDDLAWLHPALARHWRSAGEGAPPAREAWAKAIDHYARAGERAAALHANEEAIGFQREALALLDALPRDEALARRELHLQLALGAAMVAARSFAAPEVWRAYARAAELCADLGDHALTFRALRGLWQYRLGQGEIAEAARIGRELLALAARSGDAALLLEANRLLGNTAYFTGDFVAARRHMEQAVALFDPAIHGGLVAQFGLDPDVANRGLLGWALARLGHPAQGLGQIAKAVARADAIGHPFSSAYACGAAMWSGFFLSEAADAERWARRVVDVARARGFVYFDVAGQVVAGWAQARRGAEGALDALEATIGRWRAGGSTIGMHSFLVVLADAWLHAGWPDRAERTLADGLILQRGANERFLEAEIRRLRGEAAASAGRSDDAQELLLQAWEVAEAQHNRLALLRIATSMARLAPVPPGAAARLRHVHAGFAEGHDLAVLRDARAALQSISPT
jgi:tetratricopeptide (TPR) repeat protein